MRSPLQVILGFAKLLERSHSEVLDERGTEFVGWIVAGAIQLNEVIEEMLVYARVGTGDIAAAAVDLGELVIEVVGSLQRRDAQVTWGPLPTVTGDPHQLGQLLQNLVTNSCKFVPEGVTPVIHISADREPGGWCITVADNGLGVAADQQDEIFEVFSRLHSRGTYDGTGIGLAICRRIAGRHGGGRIWVEAQPGGGSRFRFTLPDRHPRASAPDRGDEAEAADPVPPEGMLLTDPATGLANEAGLRYHLARSLTRAARAREPVSLVRVKIEGLEEVAERLGLEAADEAAVEIGRRLRRIVRPPDTVGRLGTAEFAVLCVGLASLQNARGLRQRLITAVAASTRVGVGTEEFVARVSVATNEEESSADEMLARVCLDDPPLPRPH